MKWLKLVKGYTFASFLQIAMQKNIQKVKKNLNLLIFWQL